jgi:hypothetical protein
MDKSLSFLSLLKEEASFEFTIGRFTEFLLSSVSALTLKVPFLTKFLFFLN